MGTDNLGGKNGGNAVVVSIYAKKNSYFVVLEGGEASRINVGFTF